MHSSQALSAEGVATGEIAGEDAGTSSPKKHKPRKKRQDPLEPPPPPSEFPAWAYDRRDYFGFELIKQSSKSRARVRPAPPGRACAPCPKPQRNAARLTLARQVGAGA